MRKPEAPCEKCTQRSPGCHGTCKYYQWFSFEQETYKDFVSKERAGQERVDYSQTRKRRMREQ